MPIGNQITIWKDRSSYLGFFPTADWHRHGAPVLFVGVSGSFSIEFEEGERHICRSALVDSEVLHKTIPGDELMALFYFSPETAEALSIRRTFLQTQPYVIDVLERSLEQDAITKVAESGNFVDLLSPKILVRNEGMDGRLRQAADLILDQPDLTQADVATRIGLSNSRFSHFFSDSLGVNFRRFTQWAKLGKFYEGYLTEGNMTSAALAGGFSDASHFSNTHKKLLGVTPSSILKNTHQLRIHH